MTDGNFKWPKPIDGLGASLRAVDKLMLRAVGRGLLGKAAAELINSGGKRLRPALTITAASLSNPQVNKSAIQTAAAVELVHLASLIHDDLLDNDSERRGQQTTATKNPRLALLLGDYLLAKALETAADVDSSIAKLLAQTITGMAVAEAGGIGLKPAAGLDGPYYENIKGKTAGLFCAAAAFGAMCGNLPAKKIEALKSYGEAFGIAFQLIDDIIDDPVGKAQKSQAIHEIKRLNAAAYSCLSGFNCPAADSLRSLPSAYWDWASPL